MGLNVILLGMRFAMSFFAALLSCVFCIWGTFGCGRAFASVPPGTTATVPSQNQPEADPAVRHARRTACLREAKTRRLVGVQKSAFLKECFAGP